MTTNTNTKTLLTVKTDKNLKQAAQGTAKELGFSLGTLINALLKQFVRTKEVSLSVSYTPSPRLLASIALAEKEFSEGHMPVAHSVDELITELNS